jgi:beta-lactam-binding protein with PASTA domain
MSATTSVSTLHVEGLDVTVVRKRIRTVHLTVSPPDGRVLVTGPVRVSERFVRRFVHENLGCIRRHQARILEEERDDVAAGTVVAQRPARGVTVAAGTGIDVTVARAPELTTVPSVVGIDEVEALSRLRASDLTPGTRVRQPSADVPAGIVLAVDPPAGTRVRLGTVVTVVVSDGPEHVSVRSVTNRPLEEAVERLREQGFLVEVYEEPNPAVVAGSVIRQIPGAGERAPVGATVMLWVSTGADGSSPAPPVPPEDDGDGGGSGGGGG